MNIENVPTSEAAIYPPRHKTTASATEEARFIVAANRPRRRAARTDFERIRFVSSTNFSLISSSMTSVFIVFAPVMPSLKSPVICEFISRTSRLTRISRFWNIEKRTAISGTTVTTSAASLALTANMTIIAPIKYVPCHTPSIIDHEMREPIREVSLITRAWI